MSALYENYKLRSPKTDIRLIDLQPAEDESASLECRILVCSAEDPPPYIALSYTWGQLLFDKHVVVLAENEKHNEKLAITTSLDVCLRHLRDAKATTKFWIDQMCINQSDDQEKASQISLMRDIYAKADQVVAWLGEADDDSDTLIDEFKQFGLRLGEHDLLFSEDPDRWIEINNSFLRARKNVEQDEMTRREKALVILKEKGKNLDLASKQELLDLCIATPSDDPLVQLAREMFPHARDVLKRVVAFLQVPWFSRLWVVQEMALGKKVFLMRGKRHIQLYVLFSVLRVLKAVVLFSGSIKPGEILPDFAWAVESLDTEALEKMVHIRNFTQGALHASQDSVGQVISPFIYFLEMMYVGNRSKIAVTYDQDRIYGLLGLVTGPEFPDVPVEPDISPESIYAQTAKAIFKSGSRDGGETIELLNLCRNPRGDTHPKLPSWAVDWRADIRAPYCGFYHHRKGKRCFSAGGPYNRLPIILKLNSLCDKVIGLRGHILPDVIQEVGKPWDHLPSLKPKDPIQTPRRGSIDILTFFETVQSLCDKATARHKQAGNAEDDLADKLSDAYWALPIGGFVPSTAGVAKGKVRPLEITFSRDKDDWKTACDKYIEKCRLRTNKDNFPNSTLDELQTWYPYHERMKALENMKPFLTEKGFVGMAQAAAEPGDVVACFVGAETPFVLQPMRDGTYRVIGEAYCHGIMDGEALEMNPEIDIFLS